MLNKKANRLINARNWAVLVKPEQIVREDGAADNMYGKFVCEPLERGYGTTIGNALRRVLLASLQGAAFVSVKITGVQHEFTTMPGVLEDVTDIILNIKQVRLAMDTDEPQTLTLSVSRKGGYVVRALSQRAPVRSAITVDAALEKAAEFLAAHGCRDMKESYHILKDHVLTVTYCAEQNGVMCYPDMVKLAVAMDTGEMLRFDAEAYLTSHAERNLPEPAVSEEDARAMAGEGLTVQSEKLAVIPTSGAEEIYCRELICETEDGRHYLLYVNAMTGAQEKILILLEDESGTLAL